MFGFAGPQNSDVVLKLRAGDVSESGRYVLLNDYASCGTCARIGDSNANGQRFADQHFRRRLHPVMVPDSRCSHVRPLRRSLQADYRLALSGTPIENRLLDIWSILGFAMPGLPAAVCLRDLAGAGAELREVQLPTLPHAVPAYYLVATAEASSNLARYDGVRYGLRVPGATLLDMYKKTRGRGFGAEVKRRIMLGTYALSSGYYDAYYLKAQKVRALVARDFIEAFKKVDTIVTPTSPIPAFRLGEKMDDPLQMYLADIYTVTGSLAGVPSISVPCGKTKLGLPVGLQAYARRHERTEI